MVEKLAIFEKKAKKCMLCKVVKSGVPFISCHACKDNFEPICFNHIVEDERGCLLFQSLVELKHFSFVEKQENKNTNSIYWFCQKCVNHINEKERRLFYLTYPFEIQKLPQIEKKFRSSKKKELLIGDLSIYETPENLQIALAEKNLIFQDECVFLSSAKTNHNSIIFSAEQIDVFIFFHKLYIILNKTFDAEILELLIKAKSFNINMKYIPLRLAKFEECGWSVIAKLDIPKNSYICEYSGNVSTKQQ